MPNFIVGLRLAPAPLLSPIVRSPSLKKRGQGRYVKLFSKKSPSFPLFVKGDVIPLVLIRFKMMRFGQECPCPLILLSAHPAKSCQRIARREPSFHRSPDRESRRAPF